MQWFSQYLIVEKYDLKRQRHVVKTGFLSTDTKLPIFKHITQKWKCYDILSLYIYFLKCYVIQYVDI